MRQRRLGHPGIGLHLDLLSADFLNLGLRGKALGGKRQFAFVLERGKPKFMCLIGLILEELQQLWESGDQEAAKGRE